MRSVFLLVKKVCPVYRLFKNSLPIISILHNTILISRYHGKLKAMVTIKTTKKEILNTLKLLKAAVPRSRAKSKSTSCEITVKTNEVSLAIPGAVFSFNCETIGTCKSSMLYAYLLDIITCIKDKKIEITIDKYYIKFPNTKIEARTIFFTDDKILRTIILPMNYEAGDLLRLKYDKQYTPEEIAFNRLNEKIVEAEKVLRQDILRASAILYQYGVTEKELTNLANIKLKV